MDVLTATLIDKDPIIQLVTDVSNVDVLPYLSEQGQQEYRNIVLPDIVTTFDEERFKALKVMYSGQLIGFGALRDHSYITHLFVSKHVQGKGVGKQLLDALLNSTDESEISLRSSINAVSFYQSQGFKATSEESAFNGIRFVPMSLIRTNFIR